MPNASGKFIVRIHPELHERLIRRAKDQGISLNKLCASLLDDSSPNPTGWIPQKLQQKIIKTLGADLLAIFVFGSRAKNTHTAQSDLDLFLVLKSERSIVRKLYFDWDEMIASEPQENWQIYSPQFVSLPQPPQSVGSLWLEVALDGILIYESGGLVSSIIKKLKTEIAEGAYERKLTHGQPYWTRKDSQK